MKTKFETSNKARMLAVTLWSIVMLLPLIFSYYNTYDDYNEVGVIIWFISISVLIVIGSQDWYKAIVIKPAIKTYTDEIIKEVEFEVTTDIAIDYARYLIDTHVFVNVDKNGKTYKQQGFDTNSAICRLARLTDGDLLKNYQNFILTNTNVKSQNGG